MKSWEPYLILAFYTRFASGCVGRIETADQRQFVGGMLGWRYA